MTNTEPQLRIVQEADGEWHWSLYAANGEYLVGNGSQGGQGNHDPRDAVRAAHDAQAALNTAVMLGNVTTEQHLPSNTEPPTPLEEAPDAEEPAS